MKYFFSLFLFGLLFLSGCASLVSSPTTTEPPAKTTREITISPESEKLFHQAARAYGKGEHTKALELADNAISLDENNYKALSLKGIIIAFDISPDEGISYIEKSLSISPDYTQAFYDMAMAQKLGKYYDSSTMYFEKVIAVDPKNAWSYYGIATNYSDKRDKKNTLKYLKSAIHYGGADVISAASTQEHFDWLRNDADFLHLLRP